MLPVLGKKDPEARVAYAFDWSNYLHLIGDQLDSADVFVADDDGQPIASDLVIEGQSQTAAGIVSFFASGGTPGARYRIRCELVGVNSTPVRIRDYRTFILPIAEK